jgi:hypothetical protein
MIHISVQTQAAKHVQWLFIEDLTVLEGDALILFSVNEENWGFDSFNCVYVLEMLSHDMLQNRAPKSNVILSNHWNVCVWRFQHQGLNVFEHVSEEARRACSNGPSVYYYVFFFYFERVENVFEYGNSILFNLISRAVLIFVNTEARILHCHDRHFQALLNHLKERYVVPQILLIAMEIQK